MSKCNSKVVVALDFDSLKSAKNFIDTVSPELCRLKVGKEMFTYFGPDFVRELTNKGFDVFLDLKFHDIPNTVAKACVAAADLGVWMVNVHASGGAKMMQHTKQVLSEYGKDAPLLIAVTVLTSMDQGDLLGIGIDTNPQEHVLRLAKLTAESGLDGVVCSAQEASMLKQEIGQDFQLVTPGIRPQGSDIGDQKRIMTPEQAVKHGSDFLVIGRPITKAEDPVAVITAINHSLR